MYICTYRTNNRIESILIFSGRIFEECEEIEKGVKFRFESSEGYDYSNVICSLREIISRKACLINVLRMRI